MEREQSVQAHQQPNQQFDPSTSTDGRESLQGAPSQLKQLQETQSTHTTSLPDNSTSSSPSSASEVDSGVKAPDNTPSSLRYFLKW